MVSSLANAKEMRCSTLKTEIHGTLIFGEISLIFESRKLKKNSVVENSVKENASVGHAPIHAAASTPVLLAKVGRLSISCIDSGHASTHLVQSENFDVALTQAERLKCKRIFTQKPYNTLSIVLLDTQSQKARTLK
jgi:hypothetical protein